MLVLVEAEAGEDENSGQEGHQEQARIEAAQCEAGGRVLLGIRLEARESPTGFGRLKSPGELSERALSDLDRPLICPIPV